MKLGVTPWDFSDRSAQSLSAQAQQAEALGYESFWLPENHFNPGAIPDPLMLLAAVAAATTRIRLATTSYLLPLRNPLQAAEQVAVLDQLCNGRVILGIGRGYAPTMLKAFAVDPKQKRRLFESALETMCQAWRGEPVTIGEGAEAETITLDPLPVQQPHPPLWVAAFGPKALAQAGRLGYPYLASPVETLLTLTDNYARHTLAAEAAGGGRVETVPVMRTVFVAENRRLGVAVRERVQELARRTPSVARQPDSDQGSVDDWCIIGDAAYVRDRIAEYREQLQVTHLIVTRLRINDLEPAAVQQSLERVPELVAR
jgi:alkanesulfonate monooxygenase SsuD/methylene tetrahydromethanopterin reductase-like flavin-dependent oxidoreductase (luciferase family)